MDRHEHHDEDFDFEDTPIIVNDTGDGTTVYRWDGDLSDSRYALVVTGDGGNSDETTLYLRGSQLDLTKFKQLHDGVAITVIGNWEKTELIRFFHKVYEWDKAEFIKNSEHLKK